MTDNKDKFDFFAEQAARALRSVEHLYEVASGFVDERFPSLEAKDRADMIGRLMELMLELM